MNFCIPEAFLLFVLLGEVKWLILARILYLVLECFV